MTARRYALLGAVLAMLLVALLVLTFRTRERELGEVDGVITLHGKPLPDVWVFFHPDPELNNSGPTADAFTDANGRYRLHLERLSKDGAILGPHRVCFIDMTSLRGPPAISRVPVEYNTGARTPLRNIEVKPGRQTLDFDIPAGRSASR